MERKLRFYTWPDSEFDILFALKRAGLSFYWCFNHEQYILESKYLTDFKVSAPTEIACFEKFSELIQTEIDLRTMADKHLDGCPEYEFYKNEDCQFGNPVETTTGFFYHILVPSFFKAYSTGNEETIGRTYAFIEWAEWHDFGSVEENSEKTTILLYSFFEEIPQSAKALKDFPNWYPIGEIDFILNCSQFEDIAPLFKNSYSS